MATVFQAAQQGPLGQQSLCGGILERSLSAPAPLAVPGFLLHSCIPAEGWVVVLPCRRWGLQRGSVTAAVSATVPLAEPCGLAKAMWEPERVSHGISGPQPALEWEQPEIPSSSTPGSSQGWVGWREGVPAMEELSAPSHPNHSLVLDGTEPRSLRLRLWEPFAHKVLQKGPFQEGWVPLGTHLGRSGEALVAPHALDSARGSSGCLHCCSRLGRSIPLLGCGKGDGRGYHAHQGLSSSSGIPGLRWKTGTALECGCTQQEGPSLDTDLQLRSFFLEGVVRPWEGAAARGLRCPGDSWAWC